MTFLSVRSSPASVISLLPAKKTHKVLKPTTVLPSVSKSVLQFEANDIAAQLDANRVNVPLFVQATQESVTRPKSPNAPRSRRPSSNLSAPASPGSVGAKSEPPSPCLISQRSWLALEMERAEANEEVPSYLKRRPQPATQHDSASKKWSSPVVQDDSVPRPAGLQAGETTAPPPPPRRRKVSEIRLAFASTPSTDEVLALAAASPALNTKERNNAKGTETPASPSFSARGRGIKGAVLVALLLAICMMLRGFMVPDSLLAATAAKSAAVSRVPLPWAAPAGTTRTQEAMGKPKLSREQRRAAAALTPQKKRRGLGGHHVGAMTVALTPLALPHILPALLPPLLQWLRLGPLAAAVAKALPSTVAPAAAARTAASATRAASASAVAAMLGASKARLAAASAAASSATKMSLAPPQRMATVFEVTLKSGAKKILTVPTPAAIAPGVQRLVAAAR